MENPETFGRSVAEGRAKTIRRQGGRKREENAGGVKTSIATERGKKVADADSRKQKGVGKKGWNWIFS